jgi:glycosyltransferase involved in cell wall biosynthesis
MPASRRFVRRLRRVLRDPVALRRAIARRVRARRGTAPPRTGLTAARARTDRSKPRSQPPTTSPPAVAASAWRLAALLEAPPVTVVMPVTAGDDRAVATLCSLTRWTAAETPILVVGSGAPEVLGGLDHQDRVRGLDGPERISDAVRAAMEVCEGDLAIVAPGVQVGPGWLLGLRYTVHAHPRAGSSTPLADGAVPNTLRVGWKDGLPDGLGVDDVARILRRGTTPSTPPESPVGAAPVVYLRRRALDALSAAATIDDPRPEAVPARGPDTAPNATDLAATTELIADLTIQASRHGYAHVVDTRSWVHVSPEVVTRGEVAVPGASRRHPDLKGRWEALTSDEDLREAVSHARARIEAGRLPDSRPRRRVLYSVHEGDGGTPATAWDLVRHVSSDVEPLVLTSDTRTLRLFQPGPDGMPVEIEATELPVSLDFLSPSDQAYRAIVERLLVVHGVESVHVRHVYRHTLDLPEIAHALGCQVLLSLHDSYLICPTIHLLDDRGRFCGGVCTPGAGRCHVGPHWLRPAADDLKHGYVHQWQRLVRRMLADVDRIVTTSESMRQLFLKAYPHLDTSIEIVEHGRDLVPVRPTSPTGDGLDRPLRVLVPGFLAYHKGGDVLARIRALDTGGEVEFHLLGHVEKAYRDVGIDHGRYGRDDFAAHVASIDPDVAAILSVCAESYCHTLTESWAAGLPVVGTRLGAVGERIECDGGGWVVDTDDPGSILELLRQLRRDPARVAAEAARIGPDRFVPAAEMAADYVDLYDGEGCRPRVAVLYAAGQDGAAPLLAALRHPSAAVRAVAVPVDQASLVAARIRGFDAVLLAETDGSAPALADEAAQAIAHAVRTTNTPLLIWHPDGRAATHPALTDFSTTVAPPAAAIAVGAGTVPLPVHFDEYAWFAPTVTAHDEQPVIAWIGDADGLLGQVEAAVSAAEPSRRVDRFRLADLPTVVGGTGADVATFRERASGWAAAVIATPPDDADLEEAIRLVLAALEVPVLSPPTRVQRRLHDAGLTTVVADSPAELPEALRRLLNTPSEAKAGARYARDRLARTRTLAATNPLAALLHEQVSYTVDRPVATGSETSPGRNGE